MKKILIQNMDNTFNYGSLMMGVNLIFYISTLCNDNFDYYIECLDSVHVERLRQETGLLNIYPDNTMKMLSSENKYLNKLNKFLNLRKYAISISKKYDEIIILGGDDFSDIYKGFLGIKSLYKLLKLYLVSKKTHTIMVGQTIGPYYGYRKNIASKVLRKITIITRDELTKKYLKDNMNIDAVESKDLALLDLPLQNEIKMQDIITKVKIEKEILYSRYVCVVLTGYELKYSKSRDEFLITFEKVINYILDNDLCDNIIIMTHVYGDECFTDSRNVATLYERFNSVSTVHKIDSLMLSSEARYVLGHARFNISCRMHAAISSIQMGVPVLAISYSPKYKGVIAESLKLSDLVIDNLSTSNWGANSTQAIKSKVDQIMQNESVISLKIKNSVNVAKNDLYLLFDFLSSQL